MQTYTHMCTHAHTSIDQCKDHLLNDTLNVLKGKWEEHSGDLFVLGILYFCSFLSCLCSSSLCVHFALFPILPSYFLSILPLSVPPLHQLHLSLCSELQSWSCKEKRREKRPFIKPAANWDSTKIMWSDTLMKTCYVLPLLSSSSCREEEEEEVQWS